MFTVLRFLFAIRQQAGVQPSAVAQAFRPAWLGNPKGLRYDRAILHSGHERLPLDENRPSGVGRLSPRYVVVFPLFSEQPLRTE